MRRRLHPCRDQRENVSMLVSSALPEAEQAAVRDHLAQCAHCREYFQEMGRLTREVQDWARTEPSVEAGAAFRTRWKRSIQTTKAHTRPSLAALLSRCGEWLWPSPVAWGALAAVWVCLLLLQWAEPDQPRAGQELVKGPPSGRTVTFAQRQRELSSLLESLAPGPTPPRPDLPRPRSQRRTTSTST